MDWANASLAPQIGHMAGNTGPEPVHYHVVWAREGERAGVKHMSLRALGISPVLDTGRGVELWLRQCDERRPPIQ